MTCCPFVRSSVLAALILLPAASSAAQPARSGPIHLTLAETLDEALAHAPVLAALAARERAAQSKVTAVDRTRFGEVDGIATYTRYQDDVIVRAMSRELFAAGGFAGLPFDRNQTLYGVTFQVPLYLGGRLSAAVDIARLQAGELALAAEGTRWEIRANATALYAAVQTLDAVGRALDDNLQALAATRRTIELMVREGRRPELDRLKLDAQIEDVRAQRSRVAGDAARSRALLLALVGRDPAQPLEVDPLSMASPGPVPQAVDLTALALGGSPVRRAELAVRQAERTVDQAAGTLRPSIAARGDWLGHAAPSIAPLATWDVGVSVTVPLFDGGARQAGVASARAAAKAAASDLDRTRLDRAAEAVGALADLRSSEDEVRAAEAGVAAAIEAVRIEQVRYDTGAGTIEDLLLARAREVAARASLARARGARVTAAARVNAVAEREVVQ